MNKQQLDWLSTTSIYEVNLRQYTQEGTFKAFATHLPRLKKMGVGTLWLMPVTPIAEKLKKGSMGSYYACADYTAVNTEFGTLEDFKILVKDAHEQGLKVIIDWVANHTGWDHVWTVEHPDYYLRNQTTGNFKTASGMDDIIELDYDNTALRKAMIAALCFWVRETDIDGFRCDLATWVQLDFWQEAKPEVEKIKPLFWLGEYDELENPEYGEVFHASYAWKWMHVSKDFYQQQLPLTVLTNLLQQYNALGDKSMRAWFTTNHDENSWNGTEYEKYGEMALPLAVFSATWNGVPLLYSGQELPNHKRLAFFDKDVIEWTGNYELEDFYRRLLKLKKEHPALRAMDEAVTTYVLNTSHNAQVLAYLRKNKEKEILVILNFSTQAVDIQIEDGRLSGAFNNLYYEDLRSFDENKWVYLKAWDYIVLVKN